MNFVNLLVVIFDLRILGIFFYDFSFKVIIIVFWSGWSFLILLVVDFIFLILNFFLFIFYVISNKNILWLL